VTSDLDIGMLVDLDTI